MLWLVVIIVVVILGLFCFLIGKGQAEVRLKIATYGCNIQVYNVRLGYKSFCIYVDFGDGDKLQFFGSTIGEIQYRISKMCKRVAQDRDGADFKEYDTDYCFFDVGVEEDGHLLTMEQYVNLTTSAMRSTKNPITGYRHSNGLPPLYGPIDDPIRAEL